MKEKRTVTIDYTTALTIYRGSRLYAQATHEGFKTVAEYQLPEKVIFEMEREQPKAVKKSTSPALGLISNSLLLYAFFGLGKYSTTYKQEDLVIAIVMILIAALISFFAPPNKHNL